MTDSDLQEHRARLTRRHMLLGWGSLSLFVLLGVCLEMLLAFKAQLYVNADFETRRLMWRLAHAHGTLLSLCHVALALSWKEVTQANFPQPATLISHCMTGALVLIPCGFFLGGIQVTGGDPGSAIALTPAGAFLLLLGLFRLFFALKRR